MTNNIINSINLTFAQIAAIHKTSYDIAPHKKITIEETKTKYTHIYIKIGKEDMFHIAKNGNITKV